MAMDMVPLTVEAPALPPSEPKSSEPAFACEECSDLTWIFVAGRGVRPCRCRQEAYRRRKLADIPPEYEGIALESLMPDPRRHPKQARVIARMRQDPDRSYAFLGPHGTGKTALMMALYRRAVEQGRPAVWVYMKTLLDELREAELREDFIPSISVSALTSTAKGADRWFIGIDDFNVGKPTAFAGAGLLAIMNAIYNHRHQLVLTAHCSMSGLREHWGQSGEGYGGSIVRRIEQIYGGVIVDFFDQNA